jgi:exonuclease III
MDKKPERIKIISYNAKGLKGEGKRKKVINWAKRKNFDIMNIQEAHIEEEDFNKWKEDWKGTIIYSSGTNKSKGVVTIVNNNSPHKILEEKHDKEGRWTVTLLSIKEIEIVLANYYGPNEDNTTTLNEMMEEITKINTNNIILTGDFNLVLDLNKDKFGGRKQTNEKCRKALLEHMENYNLTDIWRVHHPHERKYTWISNTTPKIMCRLDFQLISDNLQGHYINSDIVPGYRSDHSCTTLTLEIHNNIRGRGFWKFNNLLTQEKELFQEIDKTVRETTEENAGTDPTLLWDTIKCKIRGKCIIKAIELKRRKNEKMEKLNNNLHHNEELLQNLIISNTTKEEIKEQENIINSIKTDIDRIIADTTRGAALRSKTLWHEEGDKSSKLFLNLEKAKGELKTIKKLIKPDGTTTTDNNEILKLQEEFYNNLYKKQPKTETNQQQTAEEKAMWELDGPKLDKEANEEMIGELTENEIWEIIKESPTNKSPGTDGLTNEFYKTYWSIIKKPLMNSLRYGLQTGELGISQRRGIISLIPKPQKNLDELKNWRPITLLNNDYKYLTKAIGKRISKQLPKIISNDQGGFVKGRYIGCNIQRIVTTMRTCEEQQINGLMTNIDFEKAFDTLDWQHLHKVMEYLNFPEQIINWTETIYNNIETCITNNGHISQFIKPQRGVRQGCPLSPYLFIIAMEVMNRWLKNVMEGYELKDNDGNNFLINQFADDTSIMLNNNRGAIRQLFKHLQTYGKISGLRINIEKTEIITLGTISETDVPKEHRKYIKNKVKYLGAVITRDEKETTTLNTEEAMKKIDQLINTWKHRRMPISGKIAIIKSLLIPQLTYYLSIMTSPNKDKIKEINRKLYNFIYNGKSEKIKREIIIGDYNDGGYKMIDLESFIKGIKLRWMERLLNTEGVWKTYIENKCKTDIRLLLNSNIKEIDLPFEFPKNNMWKEIWEIWCKENFKEPDTINEILNQQIWYNSNIRIGNKPVFWKHWKAIDINWVADLVIIDEKGRRILTKAELSDICETNINTMEYNMLISAIPKTWKTKIKTDLETIMQEENNEEEEVNPSLIEKLLNAKKPSNMIYRELIKKKKQQPIKALNKWRRDLGINWDNNTILKGHLNLHWCTTNNKTRSFNFNFLNRNIPTNKRLTEQKLRQDPNCEECGKEENITHLFWECERATILWNHIQSKHTQLTGKNFDKGAEICLLGTRGTEENEDRWNPEERKCHNLLSLLTRQYIHIMKSRNEKTNEKGLEIYIKGYLRIEKEVAKTKHKVDNFNRIWTGWSDWIE